ncbi:peptide transporter family 1-like isoform X2 [Adelges cooleyi]|uniref:peptide transporter family 1-like isoform X2 n=1 Tax=Adelges cooleyi TaxID=133065 RepID=UPI0021808947|nr:peptide transporter family 1-like isoform X2 [Adelges cooleyi]
MGSVVTPTSENSENLKFPKSVWFIICNELCERFNYYSLRTILVLYLTTTLRYSDDHSTMIYHGFIFLSYLMPLFGAVLSDSYWGKYKTVLRLSVVYFVGNVVLTGASMADTFSLDKQRLIAIIGLILISIGTGGIKPCVGTLGGDQFKLPQQQDDLKYFFSKFFVAIYIGAFISTFLAPELRKSVHCFGKDSCFPLAFGVPAILMFTAIVIFALGRNMYVHKMPEHNVIFKTLSCIFYALRQKISSPTPVRQHWIQYAKSKYSEREVSDTKAALDILLIFTAYPIFWALYEQQGSRWTLQATLMDGRIDGLDWSIKPDQMQTVHPMFAMFFILTFNYTLYPILAKVGITTQIHRIIFGFSLAVVAFVFSAILQSFIFGESTVIPTGEGRILFYNGFDCSVTLYSPGAPHNSTLKALDMLDIKYSQKSSKIVETFTLNFDPSCNPSGHNTQFEANVTVVRSKSVSYFLTRTVTDNVVLNRINQHDGDLSKSKHGDSKLRVLTSKNIFENETFELINKNSNSRNPYNVNLYTGGYFRDVNFGDYELIHDDEIVCNNLSFTPTTFYTLVLVQRNDGKMDVKLFSMDEGRYMHILWQSPQYLFMIIADVIFVATSIELSFTEAPPRIKSFISACYLLTQSVGNLLVIIIAAISFKSQVHEYLLYSGLMFIDTILLIYLNANYKYKNFHDNDIKNHVDKDQDDKQNITS